MRSVTLRKTPPQSNMNIVTNGLREYIRAYGNLADDIKWHVEEQNTNINERHFNNRIPPLIDPLAFEAGHMDLVKSIESQIRDILNGSWDGEPFTVKTIIRKVGSNGGFLSSKTPAVVTTLAGVGSSARKPDGPYVTFIPDEDSHLEARMQCDEWASDFMEIYRDPQEGDEILVHLRPSEDGLFDVCFEFNR